MDWMGAVVHTTTMGADVVSEVLMNAGALGTAIADRYDVTEEEAAAETAEAAAAGEADLEEAKAQLAETEAVETAEAPAAEEKE